MGGAVEVVGGGVVEVVGGGVVVGRVTGEAAGDCAMVIVAGKLR